MLEKIVTFEVAIFPILSFEYNSGTDKLGMDIFSQLEPVFRNEVSNFF